LGKTFAFLFWKNPTGVLWFGEKTFAFLFLEKPTRGKKPSCYLVVVAIVGKTQCFVYWEKTFLVFIEVVAYRCIVSIGLLLIWCCRYRLFTAYR